MEKENTGKYAEKEKQSVLDNAAHSENDAIRIAMIIIYSSWVGELMLLS